MMKKFGHGNFSKVPEFCLGNLDFSTLMLHPVEEYIFIVKMSQPRIPSFDFTYGATTYSNDHEIMIK